MIAQFSVYDPNTGRIRYMMSCPLSMLHLNVPVGMSTVEGAWDTDDYFVFNGEVRPRPVIDVVTSGYTLSNLPVPCTLTVDGETYDIEDGVVEFESNHPGPHTLVFDAFPYKRTKVILP